MVDGGVDVLESALRDLNLASTRDRDIVLKPEQDSAVRALLSGRDVLAVLPTGYGKSLIYQLFVRAKNYVLFTPATQATCKGHSTM